MDTFSKKDLSILFELDKNARSPLNRIAKKLKTSQQGLAYKIKKFEEHKTTSRCNKELHTLLSQFPKLIKNYFVLTNIASYEMGRKYLSEQVSYSHLFIIGGDKEQAKIDFIEQKLLKEMYENPRIPYVKLAAKYHLNPKTVISKIKKLQTQGVIKGYGANIDCSGYGYLAQKIFFTFSSLSLEKEDELMKFFRQQEHVIRVSKTFGKWDYEIDVEIKDLKEFQKF